MNSRSAYVPLVKGKKNDLIAVGKVYNDVRHKILSAELDLYAGALNHRLAAVQLYEALGGGWTGRDNMPSANRRPLHERGVGYRIHSLMRPILWSGRTRSESAKRR